MTNRIWTTAGLLLAFTAAVLFRSVAAGPILHNDSYQYVDAATHLASLGTLSVDIAHFDEQIAYGRMPMPLTHFAPGYPILMALLNKIGIDLVTTAYLLSTLGFLLTVYLWWEAGLLLGIRPWLLLLTSSLWIAHSQALRYSASALAESLFTAALMAVAVFMIRYLQGRQPSALLWIGMFGATGYALRYAGLFVLPVVVIFILMQWWRTRSVWRWAVAGLTTAALITVSIQLRNIVYSGSWRGGFASAAHNSISTVLVESVKGAYHLVFGDLVPARLDLFSAALFVATLYFVWAFFRLKTPLTYPPSAFLWIAFLSVTYIGGMMLTMLSSIAADLTRYFLPVYPLILLVFAAALSRMAIGGAGVLASLVLVGSVLAIHGRNFGVPIPPSPHQYVWQVLQLEVQPGQTGFRWLKDHLQGSAPLMAADGQATHYVLGVPVVSIIEPNYSSVVLDAPALQTLMKGFRARYLLLYPNDPQVGAQQSGPVLRQILDGVPPGWLKMAVRNPRIVVWECEACVEGP